MEQIIAVLRRNLFRILKAIIYGRWPVRTSFVDGYAILLPIPGDMPFLLRFALEGLRHLRIPNCMQILVISDGAADDHSLRLLIDEYHDTRVMYIPLRWIDKFIVNLPRSDGSANYRHFTQILRGVLATRTEAIYLHDADAFWLDEDGIEFQYREFLERGMYTLGVTSRIDTMFREKGYSIPGTWELMFSNSWVRQRPPSDIKGGWYPIPNGEWHWFDTLLVDQYVHYTSGKFGIMANPQKFVHFYATITEYRQWRHQKALRQFEDKSFNLLLLSTLAEAMASSQVPRLLPHPHELARGLRDTSAAITYLDASASDRYVGFRKKLEMLCVGLVSKEVRDRIYSLVAPFDQYFLGSIR